MELKFQNLINEKKYLSFQENLVCDQLALEIQFISISKKILLIGGGNIGYNLAKYIEQSSNDTRLKIIEKSKNRAEFLASELSNTIVINGNGLDEDILAEVNLEDVETVIALTNDDEDNLMVSVIVEKFSKNKRTMALTNKPN